MKKVHIVCFNHMDETWRRCFRDHFYYEGSVIRPYAEIEEALFNQWTKTIEKSGCNYSIEQSMPVKEYLKRNPDKFSTFKQLVLDGKIELLGGGETIIDYNMVNGESIVRSHLYSISWYKENFGRIPEIGIATDTFGLSAQLPQIYRKLGYDSLILYSRTFENSKPFWRGLDGELIYIKHDFSDIGVEKLEEADYQKYAACTKCNGDGCINCEYTGVDYSYKRYSFEYNLDDVFKKMSNSSQKDFMLIFSSEEVLENDFFKQNISESSEKYGVEVEYSKFSDIVDKFGGSFIEKLKSGNVDVSQIDERAEGNPVSTGCYVSRIELKKLNRRLEEQLLSCEKFAVFASTFGMSYPKKKIERLWNMMSFVQFHDAITGTHTDAGFEELKRVIRTISMGAAQIYRDAMETIEKQINVPLKAGYSSFVLFNPLNWKVKENIFEIVITTEKGRTLSGVTIEDCKGNTLEIVDITFTDNRANRKINVKFKGAEIPSMGYSVFYYKLTGDIEKLQEGSKNYIENEYYKVSFNDHCVMEVYDKELNENILTEGTGDLVVEDDFGSVWETAAEPLFQEILSAPYNVDNVIKRDFKVNVKVKENNYKKTIIIEGNYSNPSRRINNVDWKQEISLYQGIKKVYFKTHIDWDAYSHRIMVKFPLGFKTENDEAYYEIPYGTLKREAYKGRFGKHSQPNGDWPALNFAGCYHAKKDYTVAFINKGLPCHQVKKGVMYLSVLRSPEMPVYIFDNKGARDVGSHTFEYMITSHKGGLEEGQIVQKGMEFNTEFMTIPGVQKEGNLGAEHSFIKNKSCNIVISAIKKAENSEEIIIRAYEAYGKAVTDSLEGLIDDRITETNLLEDKDQEVAQISFEPFEIKTLKV